MEYHTGDTLELELSGLSADGRAVGRSAEGMTVFVRGGLPGQKVAARLTGVKKRMAEAEVAGVLQHAKEERPSPCPHGESCGGCPWQNMPYALQLDWKRRIVRDCLQRIGRLDLPEEKILPVLSCGEEAQWNYRNKMEFAFAADREGNTLLGLRERASRSEPAYSPASEELEARRSNKVVNIRAATQLQVVLVKPERFENASEIADHLREKRTVVLNLESTNKEIARRLLDFLSGVAYANEGKIKKVAISTYIITPYNVDILGDLIDELENNGLYF